LGLKASEHVASMLEVGAVVKDGVEVQIRCLRRKQIAKGVPVSQAACADS